MKGGDILDFYKGGEILENGWLIQKRGSMAPPYQLRTTLHSIVSEENVSCSEIPLSIDSVQQLRLC